MNTEQKTTWTIPEEAREKIGALHKAGDMIIIKKAHNKIAHQKAIADGQFDKAYELWRKEDPKLEAQEKENHKALWDAIYEALPGMDRDLPHTLDWPKGEINLRTGDGFLDAILKAASMRKEPAPTTDPGPAPEPSMAEGSSPEAPVPAQDAPTETTVPVDAAAVAVEGGAV